MRVGNITNKMNKILLKLLVLCLFLSLTNLNTTQALGSLPHTYHEQLTGEDALTDSTPYDVNGTDLGIILKHNGKYHYIFGDTFGCGFYLGNNWRSNTIAYSTDTNPSNGITLDGWIANPLNGYAKELISSAKIDFVEMTCIPTAAISYNGNIYIYYMSVSHWGMVGGNWDCNNASIAMSTDNGQTFTKISTISWSGTGNFIQFGVAQTTTSLSTGDFLYLLATPAGRYDACYLCRVVIEDLLVQTQYEYFSGFDEFGDPIWEESESEAEAIFSSPVGELSIMWNDFLNKWTAFYFDTIQLTIVVRTADELWGPWSSSQKIVGAAEYPSLYGSYVHPDFVENNGETVYFVMSIYSVYNTFIMSVELTQLTATNTIEQSNIELIIIGTIFGIEVKTRKKLNRKRKPKW